MIRTNSEFDSGDIAFTALEQYYAKNNITKPISDRVYVDVGAGQPVFYSNSTKFRENGYKIVSIDAMPRNVKMFNNIGYDILQYAVTETDDQTEVVFREYVDVIQGLSYSTIAEIDDAKNEGTRGFRVSEYTVPAKSLKTILKEHHPEVTSIDVLDVDTEGGEIGIMQGLDMKLYNPIILIVENMEENSKEFDKFYKDHGYVKFARCNHNDVLVKNN